MVSKHVISKSLSDAIVKCSRNKIKGGGGIHVFINGKVRNGLDAFREETCGDRVRKTEKVVLLNNDGEQVYSNSDKLDNQCSIDIKKVKKFYDKYGELHITHNHPNGKNSLLPVCLSKNDTEIITDYMFGEVDSEGNVPFYYYYKSITAESPNGSRMTLIRKDESFRDDFSKTFYKACDMLDDAYKDYTHKYISKSNYLQRDWGAYEFKDKGLREQVHNIVTKEIGFFEDYLVDVRKEFNKTGMDLVLEW